MPVNRNTDSQIAARSRMSDSAQAWRLLTDAQRAAWTAYGASHPRIDSLGQSITLTGFMSFVGVNSFLLNTTGGVAVELPPADDEIGALSAIAFTSEVAALNIEATDSVATGKVAVFASPPRSAGVGFESDFRFMGSAPAIAGAFEFDLTAEWTALFGAPPVDKKVFVKLVPFTAGGDRGAAVVLSGIIVA
jgi:hypothetical protein